MVIEKEIGELLRSRHLTMGTAESCTGGYIGISFILKKQLSAAEELFDADQQLAAVDYRDHTEQEKLPQQPQRGLEQHERRLQGG